MFAFSVLFAISRIGGDFKGLDVPDWVSYSIFPLAVIGILYAWRKRGKQPEVIDLSYDDNVA